MTDKNLELEQLEERIAPFTVCITIPNPCHNDPPDCHNGGGEDPGGGEGGGQDPEHHNPDPDTTT